MTAVTHCCAELDRAISFVSHPCSCWTSLDSEELCSGGHLAVVVLTKTTIIVVEPPVDSHVGKVSGPTQTRKLAIPKLLLSCDNRGVVVVKGASGNSLIPSIVSAGSAALNAVYGSAIAWNGSSVLQRELIDAASTNVVL